MRGFATSLNSRHINRPPGRSTRYASDSTCSTQWAVISSSVVSYSKMQQMLYVQRCSFYLSVLVKACLHVRSNTGKPYMGTEIYGYWLQDIKCSELLYTTVDVVQKKHCWLLSQSFLHDTQTVFTAGNYLIPSQRHKMAILVNWPLVSHT